MSTLKEYVVTLKHREDLKDFYDDMEIFRPTPYNCMPERTVECSHRRPISRNTHYRMTAEEAETLKKDPRVLAVELIPEELSVEIRPLYIQTSENFDKSPIEDADDVNWGLLRLYEGEQRPGWGNGGTLNQSGTININGTGRNVDVVLVDGHFDPDHPEYAVNSDGTGGSRVVQYNWFQHSLEVEGFVRSNYVYTPYDDGNGNTSLTRDNSHGSHCAGTACGNSQGWARGSNIYNISPYGSNPNSVSGLVLFDYIRAWHNSKPVNPETGRPNPTITNNSWGYGYFPVPITNITSVTYRGVTYSGPFTSGQLFDYGVMNFNISDVQSAICGFRYPALEIDIQDAIDDGVIMVGAAGNDFYKIDVPGGVDYDNFFTAGSTNYRYHEGGAPSSADNFICVGSIGNVTQDYKSSFSNCGPRIDIWAPGSEIQSSVNSGTSYGGNVDPRDPTNTYYLAKISGTSMASPQVCGLLACTLETYPWMTQQQASEYIVHYARAGQAGDTAGNYSDFTSLQGATDKYAYKYNEIPEQGELYPKKNYWIRNSVGKLWPRPKVRKQN